MLFINPIEILELQHSDITSLNDNVVKKTKKKIFAEIDLSDEGYFNYKGHKLTKSDCERVIDELNNYHRKEFYYQLATTIQPLNDYLVSGDEKFFLDFRLESIYQLADFLNFINPSFAQNFTLSFLKAFKNNDASLVSSILRTQRLINSTSINTAFKSVSIELQNRIAEIDKITQEIKSETSDYTKVSVKETLDFIKNNFPVTIINLLPSYFQSQINKIASSINYLQLAIDDKFDSIQVSLDLLSHLLLINIESVSKPTFENNFKIVKRRNDERVEEEKNEPVLKKWATILLEIRTSIKKVDEKTITTNEAATNARVSVNVTELNSLPPFANEIRNQIGYALRSLSISLWNAQNDINSALQLINFSLSINVSQDAKQKFETDLNDLQGIKSKIESQRLATQHAHSISPQENKSLKGILIVIVLGLLLAYIFAISNGSNNSSSTSYNNYSNNSYTPPASADSVVNSDAQADNSNTSEPLYKTIAMQNGNMGSCAGLKSLFDYSIKNKLIITTESTDAAVKIINFESSKCIRFVFINSGTTYAVKNIPEGKYYLKIAYGTNWEVKEDDPICRGHFASNALYKKDNDIYDFNKIHYDDGRVSIPYYTLKLYTTYTLNNSDNSNQPNAISEDDFSNDN